MPNPAQKGAPDLPPMSLHEEDIEWPSSAKPSSEDVQFSEGVPAHTDPDASSVKINTAPNEEETLYGAPTVGPLTGRPLHFRDTGESADEETDEDAGVEIDTEPKESNRFKGMTFNPEEEDDGEIPVSVDLSELPPSELAQESAPETIRSSELSVPSSAPAPSSVESVASSPISAPAESGVRPKGAPSADVVPLSEESEGEEEEPGKKWEISGRTLAEQSAKRQEEYQRKNISPYAPSILYPDGSEEGKEQKPESGVDGGREAA